MKLIFLDFDGVLHGNNTSPDVFEHFDNFKAVVGDTPIVLSTSWRESFKFEDLCEMLEGLNVIGQTPVHDNNTQRCARLFECLDWLEQNNMLDTDWRAIDDQRSLFEQDAPCQNLILCDERVGLSEDSAAMKQLKDFLNNA